MDGSSTTALILENVRVPAENVLGKIGEGHKVAFNILNLGKLKLGTRNMAGAKQALKGATRYSVERRQFGRPIAEFGLIKQKLAEMAVRCYVGDAMVYRTLGAVDRALEQIAETDTMRVLKSIEGFAVECSINKVWTSGALAFVVDDSELPGRILISQFLTNFYLALTRLYVKPGIICSNSAAPAGG